AHAGPPSPIGDRLARLIGEEQVGEVDAGPGAEGVIAPRARIDVEKLVEAVARIALVLELDQAVVIDLAQETLRKLLENRSFDGLHEGARPAELGGVLPQAPRDHARAGPPLLEQRAVCVLLLSIARNQLLHHHAAVPGGLRGALEQLLE